jgi:NTE family protein
LSEVHRALVLQGGVALGAYEVGVFKRLYRKIKEEDPNWEKRMFDIIAGTSIGAINAALLAGHVKKNGTWAGSAEKLENFWKHRLASPTPYLAQWLGAVGNEAARRYYSAKELIRTGARGVFSYSGTEYDTRFFDNYPVNLDGSPNITNNIRYRYSNDELKKSLSEVVNFPIATTANEPRLLTVGVDVEEGRVVTFDSHEKNKEGTKRYSIYGSQGSKITISYNDGIDIEHVMASASFPVFFNFTEINSDDGEERKFWDGGILSNTPLRELLQAHRDYWYKVRGEEDKIPELEIYIINVWPSREQGAPRDHDGIKDRRNDILYADKTEYDQRTPMIVTDYIELYRKTKEIALKHLPQNKKQAFINDLDRFLDEEGESVKRDGKTRRKYGELTRGRFKVKKIETIERRDIKKYDNSNKFADFTLETIEQLIAEGEDYENSAFHRIVPP